MKNILTTSRSAFLFSAFCFLFCLTPAFAQFRSYTVPVQTLAVPSGVAGGAAANATTTVNVGADGFAFMATAVGTNTATTGNLSFEWRVSTDGVSTNTGAALWTNTVAVTGTNTLRLYGVVPNSAIKGGIVHLTILNANNATNRVNVSSVQVIAGP